MLALILILTLDQCWGMFDRLHHFESSADRAFTFMLWAVVTKKRQFCRVSGPVTSRCSSMWSRFHGRWAGIIQTSRVTPGQPNSAIGFELDAIAAVLGGTSIAGGRGMVVGTLIGALLLGILKLTPSTHGARLTPSVW